MPSFYLKGFSLLIFVFFVFSCSNSDDTDESCCDVYPPETRKFISKIYFESSTNGLDEYIYSYDSNNNLITIEKNENLVTFIYTENRITRGEITDKATGELINYINYFYNPEGLLDYYESDFSFQRIVKYFYENGRVVKIKDYLTLADLENDNFLGLIEAFYSDDTNNIVESKRYDSDNVLVRRTIREFGIENKRYFGEAINLINIPFSYPFIVESHNYYSNYDLKSWRTLLYSTDLVLYRESFYENDTEGNCLTWSLHYYNETTGEVSITYERTYEYIDLEIN